MIRFSNAQMSSAKHAYRKSWFSDIADEIERDHPRHLAFLGVTRDEVIQLCEDLWLRFSLVGVASRSGVAQLCLIAMSIGGRFYDDPRYPNMTTLCTQEMPAARRIAYIRIETRALVQKLWCNGNAALRLREMMTAMEKRKTTQFPGCNFPPDTCDRFKRDDMPDQAAAYANALLPIAPIIGPRAMIDPVHRQFWRCAEHAGSEDEARTAAIVELERRLQVLEQ